MKKEIVVPDIGSFSEVPVIEISVKEGDIVDLESPLIVLETDKATMEIPSPFAGKVEKIEVSVGDRVSQGHTILVLEMGTEEQTASVKSDMVESQKISGQATPIAEPVKNEKIEHVVADQSEQTIYAPPGVRRFAREMGVDLQGVPGTGRKGRLSKEDVKSEVKRILTEGGVEESKHTSSEWTLPKMPKIDFSKFGTVEYQPLSRIKKLSGTFLHRNWVNVPHVTQFDEVDITTMEEFRKENQIFAEKKGLKLTPIVFLLKAVAAALQEHPHFNASLDETGQQLIIKKYFHIGVAVDTPLGLVVPVIRDVDQKGLLQLSQELTELSSKARSGQLAASEMQGGCFTISSLGGLGGTAFTPIINAPEVGILGVSKAQMRPVYRKSTNGAGEFVPRLMLPLSLSYDHRVIDGAAGARFLNTIMKYLMDIRQLLL